MNELILRLCSFSVVAAVVGSALWLASAIPAPTAQLSARADRAPTLVAQRHTASAGVPPALLEVSKTGAAAPVAVSVELR